MSDSNVVRTVRVQLEEIARRTRSPHKVAPTLTLTPTLTGGRTRPSWSGSHTRPSWSGSRTRTWSLERNPDRERTHDEPLGRPSKTGKRVHVERGSALDVWCAGWSEEAWKEYGWFRVAPPTWYSTCPTRWEYDWRYDRKSLPVDWRYDWRYDWSPRYDWNTSRTNWKPGQTGRPNWKAKLDEIDEIFRQTRESVMDSSSSGLGRPLDQAGIRYAPYQAGIPAAAPGTLAGQTGIPWSEGHTPWSEGQELAAPGTLGYPPRLPTSNALFIFDKHSRTTGGTTSKDKDKDKHSRHSRS